MDCIFCKIIKGEAPCYKIYEDEYTFVFMSTAKDVDAHILAIPKKHVVGIIDCDGETLTHLMSTVKMVSGHLVDNCGYEGVNLFNASGESADQSVPHFHIHIIPRRKGDNINTWPEFGGMKKDFIETYQRLIIEK
jgi:histidine triad (HIT) family protein